MDDAAPIDRRVYVAVAGVVLIAIGVTALWMPIYPSGSDLAQAASADVPGSDFVGECGTALLIRRAWAGHDEVSHPQSH